MKKYLNYILPMEKWMAIYAALFAIMCILDNHVVNEKVDRSTVLTTYMTPFRIADILLLIILFMLAYLGTKLFVFIVDSIAAKATISGKKESRPLISFIIIFACIMIAWIPYFMSYWPGGIYNDTLHSINIALGNEQMDNQNTVLYALFWKLIIAIGKIADQGVYGGLKLMTILQAIAIAATAAAFISWLYKRGMRRLYVILMALLVALMPIFPYYAISLWKDTLFGVIIFNYSWLIYVIVTDKDNRDSISNSKLCLYIIMSLLVAFGRNNGIYIVLALTVGLIVFYRKNSWKKLLVTGLSLIVLILLIQKPIYKAANVIPSDPVEKYGIALQQIGYIVSSNGRMSSDEQAVVESILSKDAWINLYNPTVVDSIKFDPLFNAGYFNSHTGDFVKAYLGIIIKNPALAVKGYLLATMGFWDVWQTSGSAYICTSHSGAAEYFMSDYFAQYTGITLSSIVGPRWYISSGLLIWIMILAFARVIGKKDYRLLLPVLPCFALWITLLVATPLAFSFRYVFPLLLCMPIIGLCATKTEEAEGQSQI